MVNAIPGFEFTANFSRDKWDPADFVMVKGPRWSQVRSWRQEDDHIVQNVPDDASNEQLHGPMQDEAYVAMCYGKKNQHG